MPQIEEQGFLAQAIQFTGNAIIYGEAMMDVLTAWPISCEHNLTNLGINRRAWIGHAACCVAFRCPEYLTRKAWGYLTTEQQRVANHQADIAIRTWEMQQGDRNASGKNRH